MRCEVGGQDEKFREVLIFSIFSYIYQLFGGLAQLVERVTGSHKVRGSIPLISTF